MNLWQKPPPQFGTSFHLNLPYAKHITRCDNTSKLTHSYTTKVEPVPVSNFYDVSLMRFVVIFNSLYLSSFFPPPFSFFLLLNYFSLVLLHLNEQKIMPTFVGYSSRFEFAKQKKHCFLFSYNNFGLLHN